MISISKLDNKVLALLLWYEKEGKEEVIMYKGKVQLRGNRLIFQHKQGQVEITKEWLSRIKKSDKNIADIVNNAEYVLPLRLGDIPNHVKDIDLYLKTGLKWSE